MIKVWLNLGIITGDNKRILEEYVDSRNFKQRKSYDEYYVLNKSVELNSDVELLMILSENFLVEVHPDSVIISDCGC